MVAQAVRNECNEPDALESTTETVALLWDNTEIFSTPLPTFNNSFILTGVINVGSSTDANCFTVDAISYVIEQLERISETQFRFRVKVL